MILSQATKEFYTKAFELYKLWLSLNEDDLSHLSQDELIQWFSKEAGISIKHHYEKERDNLDA
jgi:hypothetical protein